MAISSLTASVDIPWYRLDILILIRISSILLTIGLILAMLEKAEVVKRFST